MDSSRRIKFIFRLSIFFLLCLGSHAWFTWFVEEIDNRFIRIAIYAMFAFIAYMYKNKECINVQWNSFLIGALICFILGSSFPVFGLTIPFRCLFTLYPIIVLLNDKDNIREHLDFITKLLSYILVPGLVLWLALSLYSFPGIRVSLNNIDHYTFDNYIFYLKGVYFSLEELLLPIPRFNSIFIEPGYLGTLLAFLLYANRYDFSNKYNKILLISLIASFSLAGYITFIAGYVIYRAQSGHKVKFVIYFFIIMALIYGLGKNYKGGDNMFNQLILERLEFDQDKGIAGNNRFGQYTDDYFEYAIAHGKILWGDRNIETENSGSGSTDVISGAGYKVYLITNGLISAILFFFMYFFLAKSITSKRYGYGFLVLICLTFLQAAYPSSYTWLISFALGLSNDKYLLSKSEI